MKLIKKSFLFFLLIVLFVQTNIFSFSLILQDADSLIFFSKLISYPKNEQDLLEAYTFFTNTKEQALDKEEANSLVYSEIQLSRIEYKFGLYLESEQTMVHALEHLKKVKDLSYKKQLQESIYNHLGILYRNQGAINKALELYEKVLSLAGTTRDSVTIYNNKSNIFKDAGQFQQAKTELMKAYQLLPKLSDTLTEALVIGNLGYIKFKLHEDEALHLMQEALDIWLNKKDSLSTYIIYSYLSEYYAQNNDTTLATDYSFEAYQLSKKIRNPEFKKQALTSLIKLNQNQYVNEYVRVSDSIEQTRQERTSKFALLKYDLSEKERLVQEKEMISQRYKFSAIFILGGAICLLIISRVRHHKEKLKEIYHTETRISKRVHDEVANDVYYLMAKLQTESNPENDDLLDQLETVYIKSRDISREHGVIEVKHNYDTVLKDMLLSFNSPNVNVITKNLEAIKWNQLPDHKKMAVYRVLQELMVNMKKHSQANIVVLAFFNHGKKITVTYSDNGVGTDLNHKNGLQNVENRIRSVKGSITFETAINQGFKVKIVV